MKMSNDHTGHRIVLYDDHTGHRIVLYGKNDSKQYGGFATRSWQRLGIEVLLTSSVVV